MPKSADFPCQSISATCFGYMPRAVLPEVFFSFNDKLNELCVAVEGKITAIRKKK